MLTTYRVPVATNLPAPFNNLTLKHIALGHGIQNYTCSPSQNTTTPTATGALAALYDVTSYYPTSGKPEALSFASFNALTSSVLWSYPLPLNLDPNFPPLPGTHHASFSALIADPFPGNDPDLEIPHLGDLAFLGRHYFDGGGVPTFDLYADGSGDLFCGKKLQNVKAPAGADKGVLGTGAVDWLQLGDNGKGLTHGISLVYRVTTAGGVGEACTLGQGGDGSVPYAAQYWFYS